MAAVLPKSAASADHAAWWLAAAGFAAMYVPSYWVAAHGLWQSDDFGHIPIILIVALWLFWQAHDAIARAPEEPLRGLGWSLFALGIALYLLGRTFTVSSVEFLSQPLVVAAAILLLKGPTALRAAWFAVFYLVFMVPLPGTLVDAATGPLKQWISILVTNLLYAAGYPIARTGVMISVGSYQLLVADACSGLHSMFSLVALGTLFMHIVGRRSRVHSAIVLASILPIAFVANVARVVSLVLITYHLGDEAGQGFLHGAAGIVLMLVAAAMLYALDLVLGRLLNSSRLGPGPVQR